MTYDINQLESMLSYVTELPEPPTNPIIAQEQQIGPYNLQRVRISDSHKAILIYQDKQFVRGYKVPIQFADLAFKVKAESIKASLSD